ncbi:F0F1 ATP synthase subunit B [Pseudobythopirellula maris]|uniref:F0F1 ATP synthase subunit B n=1 Tax=Pseudobythopirellula maris TaxID=2527991 RepID=UPI0018D448FD|nr:F0F1 ATP synthase subunit B [Pseudobythopirellula maris]
MTLSLATPVAYAQDNEGDATPAGEVDPNVAEHDDAEHGEDVHASHAGGSPDPLEVDTDLALWTLAVFLGLAFVLKQVAWGPIIEGLQAREDKISGDLAAAAAKHEEAKNLLDAHAKQLAGAADEVRGLLEEARRDAEATKADILAEAKAAADSERNRVVRDIDQARDSAVRQLAEQSAGLAIDLAGKVVKQDITPDRRNEIVREALGRFSSN